MADPNLDRARKHFFQSRIRNDAPSLGNRLGNISPLVITFDQATSTNDLARFYASRGAPHRSLVLAIRQTSGRGRHRRAWTSLPGGLYLSIVLRPGSEVRPVPIQLLPHLVSVAAAEAIEQSSSVRPAIRWPNDLFCEGRKLAGILCESSFTGSRLDFAVAGIGVNVMQALDGFDPGLRDKITTLSQLADRDMDPCALTAAIVNRVDYWWKRASLGDRKCLTRWREFSDGMAGATVRVEPLEGAPYDAVMVGLADDGGLVVTTASGGERTLYAEDVSLLKTNPSE